MLKAYDVMTHALATCTPDASVIEVATLMRDRDIGNVLVVEDNTLRGIVTDRDLALQALTSQDDVQQTPIRKYMTPRSWSPAKQRGIWRRWRRSWPNIRFAACPSSSPGSW